MIDMIPVATVSNDSDYNVKRARISWSINSPYSALLALRRDFIMGVN